MSSVIPLRSTTAGRYHRMDVSEFRAQCMVDWVSREHLAHLPSLRTQQGVCLLAEAHLAECGFCPNFIFVMSWNWLSLKGSQSV